MEILLRQLGFDPASAARNSERLRESLPSNVVLTPQLRRADDGGWRLVLTQPDVPASPMRVLRLPDTATSDWPDAHELIGASAPLPTWPGPTALQARGRVDLRAPDADPSDPALQQALTAAPTDPSLWRTALALADRNATPNQAASLAERALGELADVQGHEAMAARALAQWLLGEFEVCAASIEPLLAAAPSDLPLQRLWARVQAELHGPEAAIAPLQRVVREDPQNLRAWYLLGRYAFLAGDTRRAVDEYLVRALVLAQRTDDTRCLADVRNLLGLGYQRFGQTDAAIEHFKAAAAARESFGDALGAANSLRNLAAVEAIRGAFGAAEAALQRAESQLDELDAPQARADLLNDRGLLAEERGDYRAALAAYRGALILRQDLGGDVAESQNNVGFAYYQIGEFDNALVYWRQAEAEYAQRQDRAGHLRARQSLAMLESARGQWSQARQTLVDTLHEAEAHQLAEEQAISVIHLAVIDRLQGQIESAFVRIDLSAKLAIARQDHRLRLESGLERSALLLATGDWNGAENALTELDIEEASTEQRAIHGLRLAQVALGRRQPEHARAALEQAQLDADAAHSQPAAIEIALAIAELAQRESDMTAARAALARADAALERFAPLPLALLAAEARLRSGDVSRYEAALALLRRAPDYGRTSAIHHAAARALRAAGSNQAASRARARWIEARDALRTRIPATRLTEFDALPEQHDPLEDSA
jgi:tetratricopeptide (TPR) repeat protein